MAGNDLLEGGLTRVVYLDFDTYELPGQHFYTQAERDEIQAQIEADYADFSYAFTQTQPQSGPYTTIDFNDPALVGLEGGIASEIDWRDLDISGTTTLTAQRRCWKSSAPIQAGSTSTTFWAVPASPPPPAPTSSASRPPSPRTSWATSPALQHADSFGPIGSGIYSGVNPELYNPPYPGPTDADETILHIMASGASVDSTLEDAINDPFFGEREAIALAYGENGSPTNEETTAHDSMADAQPICPRAAGRARHRPRGRQRRPGLRRHGRRRRRLPGDGLARRIRRPTYYSFTAQAGTLINFQVMSALLIGRPTGAFEHRYLTVLQLERPRDRLQRRFVPGHRLHDHRPDAARPRAPITSMVTSSPKSVADE